MGSNFPSFGGDLQKLAFFFSLFPLPAVFKKAKFEDGFLGSFGMVLGHFGGALVFWSISGGISSDLGHAFEVLGRIGAFRTFRGFVSTLRGFRERFGVRLRCFGVSERVVAAFPGVSALFEEFEGVLGAKRRF